MQRKEQLIKDIENLLNSYTGITPTSIDPALLEFMDENTLVDIISSLLEQKENLVERDIEWLTQFKIEK